ncbi:hypothetical protein EW146_g1270 [Bondarzewia mesenterica]|uniref:ARID domain-containing protein n=1 Tax=Bondarzewia mesenterica TaxID=1095465 RepID=A0A4S4M4G9_9AGAM|nr:hypothetical protein EW146_g1270 [Bondarzewia mesenterica]
MSLHPQQQQNARSLQQQQSSTPFSLAPPQSPTSALTGNPDPSSFFNLDASAAAKQMAALNAAGLARMAQISRAPTSTSVSSGGTSGALLGGMSIHHQQQQQQQSPPSAAPGHDPLLAFPQTNRHSFQAQQALSNSIPHHQVHVNSPSHFNPQSSDQLMSMSNQVPRPQQAIHLQAYRQKQRQFLSSLAALHASRNTPLPPTLTGVPTPTFDPQNNHWSQIEPSATELGCIRLAGKDVDLFKLWTTVYPAGGGVKLTRQGLWSSVLPHLDLPEFIPQANAPQSVADILAQIYMAIMFPFEEVYRRGTRDREQQQRAILAANAQGGLNPQHPAFAGMQQQRVNSQAMMAAAMSHGGGIGSAQLGQVGQGMQASPQSIRQSSGPSMNLTPQQTLGSLPSVDSIPGVATGLSQQFTGSATGATFPMGPQSQVLDGNIPFDTDFENRKRKVEAEEDSKRTRQKTTEPPDSITVSLDFFNALHAFVAEEAHAFAVHICQSTLDRSSIPPSSGAAGGLQAPATMQTQRSPSAAGGQPQRRKIEYVPLSREVNTSGGRDVRTIAEEQARTKVRQPLRDVGDWGNIDIDALTMSVRSRIATELSYALTTFTLLSIMRGQTGSGFPIANCPELMDEVLDLVVEVGLDGEEEGGEVVDEEEKITTHVELVSRVEEEGNRPFAALEQKQGKKPIQLGHKQRPGAIILTVTNIIRNLSIVPDNHEFLAKQERLLPIVLRLCGVRRLKNGELQAVSPALSLGDLVSVRRDTLYTLVNLAPLTSLAPSLSATPSQTSMRLAKRTFSLVSSYLVDPSDTVSPLALLMQSGLPLNNNPGIKPPPLIDAALEVFTRLGQPDANRRVISKAVPLAWQRRLFEALVHRLPIADSDFQVVARDTWLSYIDKVIMGIYALAFLASPELKRQLKKDRNLGFARVMLRLVKKFIVAVPDSLRPYWRMSAHRATEAMKVLDDGEDAFDTTQSTGGAGAFVRCWVRGGRGRSRRDGDGNAGWFPGGRAV